ncbi:MAG: hypothetical protein BA863_06935 [Desulfovibrio sp. S3730MH75]|nr:MAG: hypothetical protein BA863_06935 [Desulfovibrio sp. S3730MH75]
MKKILIALAFTFCFVAGTVYAADLTVITENSPPLNYEENGKVTGLATELVQEIMRRTGQESSIDVMPWARGYALVQGQPNVALYSTTRTEARENLFKWVGPLATIKWVFFAKTGSGIKISSLADAKKVGSIATYANDAKEQMLKAEGFTNLDSAPDTVSNLKKLMAGRNDIWLVGENEGVLLAQQNGFAPSDLEQVFIVKEVQLSVAFSKSTPDATVNVWQKAFDEMIADGFVKKTTDKWAK